MFVVFLLQMADSMPSPASPHPKGRAASKCCTAEQKPQQVNSPVCRCLLSNPRHGQYLYKIPFNSPIIWNAFCLALVLPAGAPVPSTLTKTAAPLMGQGTQGSKGAIAFLLSSSHYISVLRDLIVTETSGKDCIDH